MTSDQLQNSALETHKQRLMNSIKKLVPESAVAYCAELIMQHQLHLHISESRKTKLGDYHPHTGKGNHITVNHDLNPYHFLITFLHELAHHQAYTKYGPRHDPHGIEWKQEYKIIMLDALQHKLFPNDLAIPIMQHMRNPSYTHTGDVKLMKALMRYDKAPKLLLDDLLPGDYFVLENNERHVMQKGNKRRVNHECIEVRTQKKYLVKGIAAVKKIPNPSESNG